MMNTASTQPEPPAQQHRGAPARQGVLFEREAPEEPGDLHGYDFYVVAFSGGKDSLACLLELIERGVDRSKIELWHHEIDGREGSELMDWPVTPAYCEAVADALGVELYYSWKEGGFEREMLREEDFTADVLFEAPAEASTGDGNSVCLNSVHAGTLTRPQANDKKPKRLMRREAQKQERFRNTRRKFPQVSADLSVRWCSAYLKMDVAAAALRGQERFRGAPEEAEAEEAPRTLFLTGERADESPSRSRYAAVEPHRADLRDGERYVRHIDHWRPVHRWDEADVWEIIERHGVRAHPAYYLGFGRTSCMACIFGSANQFATVEKIAPEHFERLANYEEDFQTTIKRDMALPTLAAHGQPYDEAEGRGAEVALAKTYDQTVLMGTDWMLPAGAFGESCGPT